MLKTNNNNNNNNNDNNNNNNNNNNNKRVRPVLKSKLNGGNVINAITIWVVATVWYGAQIINWNKGKMEKID